ncbi:MAG: Malonyl CoA-acyl carrier protein transacylase [Planctomycetes bacterium ADurb.Bin412]|nr:MAG: Malonyl CoA-acyl carrier protein transacylase [Planctomycetes bacterium ADurb.Bin412]
MNTIFMFPGQGAQQVGMGRDLALQNPQIADLYRRANQIVGYDLASVCFEGPEETLNTTEISQPAIFVTSAACLAAMRGGQLAPELSGIEPDACAGLSLGEYTALYAAGVMDFEQALTLVQLRGRSMQEAANQSKGSMVSILGLEEPAVNQLCQAVLDKKPMEENGQKPMLVPVNFNCPGQIVVSGTLAACRMLAEMAESFGASKAIPLKVAGAFHTSMMDPAAEKLSQALENCRFGVFSCPVVANVDAQWYEGVSSITPKLLAQLVSPVRWQQCVEFLLNQGAQRFIEIGPGRVLTGLVKKISRVQKKTIELITVNGMS